MKKVEKPQKFNYIRYFKTGGQKVCGRKKNGDR